MKKSPLWSLVFFLIFSTFNSAFASSVHEVTFSYTVSEKKEDKHKERLFETLKESLLQENLFFAKTSQSDVVDGMFFTESFDKAVFVKYGFKTDADVFGKILNLPEGFLYHNKDKSNAAYALFFQGFEEEEVVRVLKSIKAFAYKLEKKSFWSQVSFPFISSAYAQEECFRGIAHNFGDISKVASWGKTAVASSKACLVEAFIGVWNGSVGAAIDLGKGVKKLVQSSDKVWSGASNLRRGLQNFNKAFDTFGKKYGEAYSSMSFEDKAGLMCSLASSLSTAGLITFYTNGYASPLVVASFNKAFNDYFEKVKTKNSGPAKGE